jgi:hypothetical protein
MKQFIPILLSNILGGLALLVVFYFLFMNYRSILGMEIYKKLMIFLLISVAISAHGFTHFAMS